MFLFQNVSDGKMFIFEIEDRGEALIKLSIDKNIYEILDQTRFKGYRSKSDIPIVEGLLKVC